MYQETNLNLGLEGELVFAQSSLYSLLLRKEVRFSSTHQGPPVERRISHSSC